MLPGSPPRPSEGAHLCPAVRIGGSFLPAVVRIDCTSCFFAAGPAPRPRGAKREPFFGCPFTALVIRDHRRSAQRGADKPRPRQCWSCWPDSNQPHDDYKSSALPNELQQQIAGQGLSPFAGFGILCRPVTPCAKKETAFAVSFSRFVNQATARLRSLFSGSFSLSHGKERATLRYTSL